MFPINTSKGLGLILRGYCRVNKSFIKTKTFVLPARRVSYFMQGEFHTSCKESFIHPDRIEGESGIYQQWPDGNYFMSVDQVLNRSLCKD